MKLRQAIKLLDDAYSQPVRMRSLRLARRRLRRSKLLRYERRFLTVEQIAIRYGLDAAIALHEPVFGDWSPFAQCSTLAFTQALQKLYDKLVAQTDSERFGLRFVARRTGKRPKHVPA